MGEFTTIPIIFLAIFCNCTFDGCAKLPWGPDSPAVADFAHVHRPARFDSTHPAPSLVPRCSRVAGGLQYRRAERNSEGQCQRTFASKFPRGSSRVALRL